MDWLLSPLGAAVIVVLIVAAVSLIYWQRRRIKRWLTGRKVGVKLKIGPVEVSLDEKDEARKPASMSQAGVDFGTRPDFSGARVEGIAGRDIRRGAAASGTPGGKTPGVDFGKEGTFRDAEIEDVAGRDIVED